MQKRKTSLEFILLILLALIWGSSFILMKKGLRSFAPEEVAAWRLVSAGLVLLPFFFAGIWKEPRWKIKYFFLSGLLGNGLPAFMFTYAQTHISSSTAGALNALTPLFTLMIGVLAFGSSLNIFKVLGVLLGLCGALILILLKSGGGFEPFSIYAGVVVLAALFYAININIIKHKLVGSRPLVIASIPIVFMAVPSLFILLFTGFFNHLPTTSFAWNNLGLVTILGMVGTALALIAYNRLIQLSSAVFASSVTYMMPVVAMGWGYVDGESVGLVQAAGILCILGGVLLVNKGS